jgi:streptomycin 6-kinase
MQIPESFDDNVKRIFGEKGVAWRKNLPQLLEVCMKKWNLSNCRLSKHLSMNLICFAESLEYGEVALKVGVPHADLFTEMKALSFYAGRQICKCYDYDIELGAMVLEKVDPGVQLKDLSDSVERINIGSDVISRLPIFIEDTEEFPIYAKWVEKAFKRAREENKVGEKMLYYIDEAEIIFKEIENSDKRRVLLHGDLHHENILQDKDGSWKAIDPKGVIGPMSMEAARFIENEFSFVVPEERLRSLDKMTTIFSDKLGTSKRMIAACSFVLMVLSICWCFEDYSQSEKLYEDIKDCQVYLDYVQQL